MTGPMKRISIITPCRNAEKYILETVDSVLSQSALISGRAELEYIICDGLSTDRTLEIARAVAEGFAHGTVSIVSRQDTGMYDALAHGLKMATGDIVAYINAGDYYSRHAFDAVLDVFEAKRVKWLTGFSAIYNERSQLVEFYLPFGYRKRLFDCGAYGKMLVNVQQESTFWSAELNGAVVLDRLARFKYAGDYYLWHSFSRRAELHIAAAYLGGFRRHQGQLSEDMGAYRREMDDITGGKRPGILDRLIVIFDGLMWKTPPVAKRFVNRKTLHLYDHERQEWV